MPSARSQKIKDRSVVMPVPLAKIRVDTSYQREPSQALVDRIADEWDVVASELVLVSDRGPRKETDEVEGGFFIVNGQHRTLAARKKGLETIDARVINLRQEPDPAKIEAAFRLKTNVRMGDRSMERFKAQLRSGDEDSIQIVKLLARFDTEINFSPNMDTGINAVSAVEGLYRLDQGAVLQEALEVIKETYGAITPTTASGNTLKSIAWFIEKHAMNVNRDRLIEKLKTIGRAALDNRARANQATMGGALWLNYYRSIVSLYNERLQARQCLEVQTRGGGRAARDRDGEVGVFSRNAGGK